MNIKTIMNDRYKYHSDRLTQILCNRLGLVYITTMSFAVKRVCKSFVRRGLPRLGSASLARTRYGQRSALRRPMSSSGGANKGTFLSIQKMLDEDPKIAAMLVQETKSIVSVGELGAAVTRVERMYQELESAANSGAPTFAQLQGVFLASSIPFVGFGIIDNAIMIIAGDYIDMTMGVTLGISTMAAAGLGNLVSDVAGVWAGSSVEKLSARLGFSAPVLTRGQMKHKWTKRADNYGSAVGVALGCLIGMFPLLFMDSGGTEVKKQKLHLEMLFHNVFQEVGTMLNAESATLFLLDDATDRIYSYAVVNPNMTEDNAKIYVPANKGLVGACAMTKQIVNVPDVSKDDRFYPDIDAQTGFTTKSVLAMPIFGSDGTVTGVVEVVNKKTEAGHFTADDERLLRLLCSHIGLAVSNIKSDGAKELQEAWRIVKHYHQ